MYDGLKLGALIELIKQRGLDSITEIMRRGEGTDSMHMVGGALPMAAGIALRHLL